ncbi:MAG: heavy-metal-associated domain-containing protein [Erysipelotrichaceae bacterium]|jgi:copper chaperone CopZ
MYTYKITVEDMKSKNCAEQLREAFEDESETAVVTFNVAKRELFIDSDFSVEEIYEIIEDAGFTPGDLELV